jgi:hypothetical protein
MAACCLAAEGFEIISIVHWLRFEQPSPISAGTWGGCSNRLLGQPVSFQLAFSLLAGGRGIWRI